MNEYKFQYSQTDGNGGILVARTDDKEEVAILKDFVDVIVGKKQSQGSTVAQTTTTAGVCKKHNVPMKLNRNGKPYHLDNTRAEGDKFCNGRGWPSEFEGKSSKEIGEEIDAANF